MRTRNIACIVGLAALLDSVGASTSACFLQQAIDVMTDAPIPTTIEEVEAAFATPECAALLERLERY